ncbi:hypothetical protein OSTOST_25657, partial [Ostertagia ostertagi]
MMERTRVQFQVRVLRLKLWEKMFVCGSDIALGEWDPLKAFPLTKSLTDRIKSVFISEDFFVNKLANIVLPKPRKAENHIQCPLGQDVVLKICGP